MKSIVALSGPKALTEPNKVARVHCLCEALGHNDSPVHADGQHMVVSVGAGWRLLSHLMQLIASYTYYCGRVLTRLC